MNDLALNFFPVNSDFMTGTMSSGFNRSVFNAVPFNGGQKEVTRYYLAPPIFWGITVNGGGGWASSGIVGTYYANNNYTGTSFQRTDVRIDIPNTTVLPGGSLPTDPVFGAVPATNFSVKWIGSLIPKYTETYTFKVHSGGTLVLKIAGTTIATATSTSGWVSANLALTANTTYAVEVDYVQGTGPWGAQVHWLSNGANPFPEEAIGPATPIAANFADMANSMANGAFCAIDYQSAFGGGFGPALDSSGWPTGDFAVGQMSDPNYSGSPSAFPNGFTSDGCSGLWTITFNGAADLYYNGPSNFLLGYDDGQGRTTTTIGGVTYYQYGSTLSAGSLGYHAATNTGYHSTTNTTRVLHFHPDAGYANLQLSNTDRNGVGTPSNPGTPAKNGVTYLACMRPSSIGAMTSLPPGTTFNPAFLAALAPYVAFRDNTYAYIHNYAASVSSPPTDWQKWAKPIFSSAASTTADFVGGGVDAWEWRVQLANQAGKDMYINLPQTASGNPSDSDYSSSFIYQLANLIKNGSTYNGIHYPGLLPHLNVYIEYGNENWNYSLIGPYGSRGAVIHEMNACKQASRAAWQQYVAMGGAYTVDGSGNLTDAKTTLWNALKVKDASDLFRMVFGDSVMPGGPAGVNPDPRIRPIFEWQHGGGFNGEGYPSINAFQTISSYFGVPINHIYWGGGGAWYSDNNTAGADANAVFSNLPLSSAVLNNGPQSDLVADMAILASYNLHHVGYEGGFDFGDGGNSASVGQQLADNDSRITPYVEQSVNQYYQCGCTFPVVEAAVQGPYGYKSEWVTIDGIYNSTVTPKLQGYVNRAAALPAATNQLPVVPSTSFPVPVGFSYLYQVFYVPFYGKYLLGGITDWHWGPFGTGLIHVVLDGVEIGEYQTVTLTGNEPFWFPAIMGQGVHGMKIYFTNVTGGFTIYEWGVLSG